jgi:hypothetical protein
MASAFSEYLPHFAANALGGLDVLGRVKPLGSAGSEKREVDLIADAEARGRQEGREAALIEFEKTRAEDLADFDFRLAEQKQQWVEETAAAIAAQIDGGLAEIEASVSGHVARVLARFLESAVEQRALSELAGLLGAAMVEGTVARIRIAGPETLLASLRQQPAARAAAIEYSVAADKAEVSVTIGDTILETQLAAWGERIVAAVAGESHV